MGLLSNLKSALGMGSAVRSSIQLNGQAHLGEPLVGTLNLTAQKPCNVFTVGVRLIHHFPENNRIEEVVIDELILAERVSFQQEDTLKREFEFDLPVQAVPTLGDFGWSIQSWLALQGGADIHDSHPITVHWAELTGAVVDVLTKQFGFFPQNFNADEFGLWVDFRPDPSVSGVFKKLVCSFDEQPDGLDVSLNLQNFQPSAIRHLGKDYDPRTNSAVVRFRRDEFVVKNANFQGIFHRLQPIFSIQ